MAIKYDSNDTYYAYENGVLRNKYGIKNQSKLDKLEGPIVLARIATIELKTKLFDLKYICDINKYLFSDIYE
jgi:fido (protein-threonine AMPylation protein)